MSETKELNLAEFLNIIRCNSSYYCASLDALMFDDDYNSYIICLSPSNKIICAVYPILK